MKKTALLLLSIVFLTSSNAYAMFDTPFWGVRAIGMGGAYTAVSDDVNAPAYNVAGTAGMEKPEITAMSAKLFVGEEGLDFSVQYLEGVYPISKKGGALSLGWFHFGDTGLYSEDTISLGYANTIYTNDWVKLLLGLNFKYLTHGIREDNGEDLSKGGPGIDVGIIARFKHGISVGYSGKYLNSPDLGIFDEDKVSPVNTVGLAYYNEDLPLLNIPHFTIAADYEMRRDINTLLVGMESRILKDTLALRAGGWAEQLNFGLGYKFEFKDKGALYIDYAFGLPLKVQETYGSHFFSLSYRFD